MCRWLHLVFALCTISAAAAWAADGSVKLKFTLDGTPPKPKVLAAVNPCGGAGPVLDRGVVVGKKNELQNVVVYLYVAANAKPPQSDAALKALPKSVQVDNKGCHFEPRLAALHVSQQLIVGNPDPVGHNVNFTPFANAGFNELIPAGGKLTREFPKGERRPMPFACTIHPFMSGYLLISDHPFFGISDETGVVTIAHVPEGKHIFSVWHEKAGYVTHAKQNGKDVEWKKGQLEVNVKGDVDLGEIKVPVELVAK